MHFSSLLYATLVAVCYRQVTVFCQIDCSKIDFNKLDVVFALDGSSSVGREAFEVARQFLIDVIDELAVGPISSLIGVLQFPKDNSKLMTKTEINLGSIMSHDGLRSSMNLVNYQDGGLTNTEQAIIDGTSMLLKQGRKDYPKVLVILTDGQSDNEALTVAEAEKARKQNITLISVGITTRIRKSELIGIAGTEARVIIVSDFAALVKFVAVLSDAIRKFTNEFCYDKKQNEINVILDTSFKNGTELPVGETVNMKCKVTPPAEDINWAWLKDGVHFDHPNAVQMITWGGSLNKVSSKSVMVEWGLLPCSLRFLVDCSKIDFNKLDVVFALDGSSSVGREAFEVARQFLIDVIDELAVGPISSLIGVLQFPKDNSKLMTKTEINLGSIISHDGLRSSMNLVNYQDGGLTNTEQAIIDGTSMLLKQGRKDYPKVLVILTDGQSDNEALTVAEAEKARKQNITLVSVGITTRIRKSELVGIAGTEARVIIVSDFAALVKFVAVLSDAIRKFTNEFCYDKKQNEINVILDISFKNGTELPLGETVNMQCRVTPPAEDINWVWLKDGVHFDHPNAVQMITLDGVEYRLGFVIDEQSSGEYVLRVTYPNGVSKSCPPCIIRVNPKLPPSDNDKNAIDQCRNGVYNKVWYESDVPKYCVLNEKSMYNGKCMEMEKLYNRLSQLRYTAARAREIPPFYSYEYKRFNLQVLGNVYGTQYTNDHWISPAEDGFQRLFIEGLNLIQETHPEINFVTIDNRKFGPTKFCEMALYQFPYAGNFLIQDVVPKTCPRVSSLQCVKSSTNRAIVNYPTHLNLVYYKDRKTPLGCFVPRKHVEHNRVASDQCISLNDAINILNVIENNEDHGVTPNWRWPLAGVQRVWEWPYANSKVDPVVDGEPYRWGNVRSDAPRYASIRKSIPQILKLVDTAYGYFEDQKINVTINNINDKYGSNTVEVSYQAFCGFFVEMVPMRPTLFRGRMRNCTLIG